MDPRGSVAESIDFGVGYFWQIAYQCACDDDVRGGVRAGWLAMSSVKDLPLGLDFATAFHGFPHGYFVGEFEITAYGDTHCDAGYFDSQRLQEF
jgi:hypothetical protein